MNLSLNYFADQFVFWNLKKNFLWIFRIIDSKGINIFLEIKRVH